MKIGFAFGTIFFGTLHPVKKKEKGAFQTGPPQLQLHLVRLMQFQRLLKANVCSRQAVGASLSIQERIGRYFSNRSKNFETQVFAKNDC